MEAVEAMQRMLRIVLALAIGMSLANQVTAQVAGVVDCALSVAEPGSIVGRLVHDRGGLAEGGRVRLENQATGLSCRPPSNRTGRFEFTGLLPGEYLLHVAPFGINPIAPIEPIPITVAEGESVRLSVPVFLQNRIVDCMTHARCGAIMSRLTSAEVGGDDDSALRLLGYRLTIALAGERWTDDEWTACVHADERDRRLLESVYSPIAAGDACQFRVEGLPSNRADRNLYVEGDRPGRSIRAPSITRLSDSDARISTEYQVGRLWGQTHSCRVVRIDGIWVPRSCVMMGIS